MLCLCSGCLRSYLGQACWTPRLSLVGSSSHDPFSRWSLILAHIQKPPATISWPPQQQIFFFSVYSTQCSFCFYNTSQHFPTVFQNPHSFPLCSSVHTYGNGWTPVRRASGVSAWLMVADTHLSFQEALHSYRCFLQMFLEWSQIHWGWNLNKSNVLTLAHHKQVLLVKPQLPIPFFFPPPSSSSLSEETFSSHHTQHFEWD